MLSIKRKQHTPRMLDVPRRGEERELKRADLTEFREQLTSDLRVVPEINRSPMPYNCSK